MSEEAIQRDLASALQNDIDTLELSGALEEDKTLMNTFHQTQCMFSVTGGEAECTCLPITIDVEDVINIGVARAAEMLESYLTYDDDRESQVTVIDNGD